MKIILGARFKLDGKASPLYALEIEGLGYIDLALDDDTSFWCAVLDREQLITLKGLIEKELNMKEKKIVPFNKREEKNMNKAFAKTEKSVKPVAKDTNKTRRKRIKPTKGQAK